jgi:AcrR family transcriptional regulator
MNGYRNYSRVKPGSTRRSRLDPEQVRAYILEEFSARAKRFGIRALIMTELASELRMSAATLYKLYPSKEALAMACVDRWADELGAAEAAKSDPKLPRAGFEQYMHWIDAWADANAALSPAFVRDLKSDYPAVWQRYRELMAERKRRGAVLLRPLLKPGVDERVAFAVLDNILSTVVAPSFADRLHVSRREALRGAMAIWAGGALARGGKLRSIRGDKKSNKR